jgi:hypothetical protein
MRTVQQQIDIGNASCIYAANELRNGKRHGGLNDVGLPTMIYVVREGLERLYDLDSADADLDTIGNYLISICKDAAKAEANIVGGGALPIVLGTTPPAPLDWIVSASSIPLATGETSVTLTQFIGYSNLNFYRGGIAQYTTDPGGGATYYSWNSSSGLFQLLGTSPEAVLDESMRISL